VLTLSSRPLLQAHCPRDQRSAIRGQRLALLLQAPGSKLFPKSAIRNPKFEILISLRLEPLSNPGFQIQNVPNAVGLPRLVACQYVRHG
jgi:hypothetical protein